MYDRVLNVLARKYNFSRRPTDEEIDAFLYALKIRKMITDRLTNKIVEDCVFRNLPSAFISLNESEHMSYERTLIATLSRIVDEL